MVNAAGAAFSCTAKEAAAPLAEAVSVAVWVVLTAATEAVSEAVVEPAGTVSVAGRVTAVLLLASETVSPPLGAAALRVTVQVLEPEPVIEAEEQDSEAGVTEVVLPLDSPSVALKAEAPKAPLAVAAEPLGLWM